MTASGRPGKGQSLSRCPVSNSRRARTSARANPASTDP